MEQATPLCVELGEGPETWEAQYTDRTVQDGTQDD